MRRSAAGSFEGTPLSTLLQPSWDIRRQILALGRYPLSQSGESENRLALDRVRSNAGVAMLEVEEGDPGDTGASADANTLSPPGHLRH